MPQAVLRFYGRFVFAEEFNGGTSRGELNALAVNMAFNHDVGADPHQTVLTALRNTVRPQTTLPPDFVLMSATNDLDRAEHAVWRVEPRSIQATVAGATSPFKWHDRRQLADLKVLVDPGAALDRSALVPGPRGKTISVVKITTGVGVAEQLIPGEADLVPFGKPNDPATGAPVVLADKVDVRIELPPAAPILTLKMGRGANDVVVLGASGEIPLLITFSNLCNAAPRDVDTEFAGLYEVLQTPPQLEKRQVPRSRPTESRVQDCYSPAFIAF